MKKSILFIANCRNRYFQTNLSSMCHTFCIPCLVVLKLKLKQTTRSFGSSDKKKMRGPIRGTLAAPNAFRYKLFGSEHMGGKNIITIF